MWFAERKELNICFSEKNLRLKTENADTNARAETYAQAVERGISRAVNLKVEEVLI